jgi:hypothetical protein
LDCCLVSEQLERLNDRQLAIASPSPKVLIFI